MIRETRSRHAVRTLIPGLLLALICGGCGALQPGIRGSGVPGSELRQVAPFHEIDLAGIGTADVFVGEQHSVEVTTDDNLLPEVETSVQNGVLKIRPRRSLHPQAGLNISVTVPELTATRVSGAGDMLVRNISGDSIEMTVSGAGSITADGHVQNLRTRVSGAGDANLRDLVAHTADVRISGAGDATVFALETLHAKVSGAGDIVCHGSPLHVEKKVSGAGDIDVIPSSTPQLRLSDQSKSGSEQSTR